MRRKKEKKDRTIRPILWAGFVVLAVCLITCVVHIRDLRKHLENEINDQLAAQLAVASRVLSDEIAGTQDVIGVAADEMGEKVKSSLSDSQMYRILQKYKPIDDFVGVAYVSEESVIYYDEARKGDVTAEQMQELDAIEERKVFVANDFNVMGDGYLLIFVEPVENESGRSGFLLGVKSCEDILEGDSFAYLKEVGDILVTNDDGVILDCNLMSLGDQTEDYETIYDIMSDYRNSNDAEVWDLKQTLRGGSQTEGRMEIADGEDNRYFYSFASVENLPQMYLISVYTDDVFEGVEGTIIVGSVVTCLVMVGAMLLLVFMAYRHNATADQMITKLAFEDEITGGKNLNYFKKYVPEVLEKYLEMPFLIHRFDIANFRYINETYGHEKADQLLKIVNEEAGAIFYSRELCVRMNADQFVMLTRNTQDLEERFFVFTDKVNARALDIGVRYPIKFKRGVYQIRGGENDVSQIIDKANAARKELTGEERESMLVYSDQIVQGMRKVDEIESEMEAALINDEFKMFVQPKWDIREDHLYGGEALVRWIKEDGSMVYPSDFVPVFERNGFVEQLDMHMLEMTCRMLRRLIDEGKPIYPISVNQSRLLLHDPAYIGKITEILDRYNIPEGYIELEITETVFFTERNKMVSILNELKAKQVSLSMDDFGSGYSSLNMLKDFPFDVLKIDKEFFSETITSKSSIWILRMIIEMAEGLGIRVICEGVETKEQVEMLRKIGCRYVQGYYYSKPIPAERFVELYCKEGA